MKVYIVIKKDFSSYQAIQGIFKQREDAINLIESLKIYEEDYFIESHEVIE